MPSPTLKLSNPSTREFWEIPILFEDEHLLIIDKPHGLPVFPDANAEDRHSLSGLLLAAVDTRKPWVLERGLTYLQPVLRQDDEMSGVHPLAKSKEAHAALASYLGSEQPNFTYAVLVQGIPPQKEFTINAPLAAHPTELGLMHISKLEGKKSKSLFTVVESFNNATLLHCRPLTHRPHQLRVHLRSQLLPVFGDTAYGGPPLLLSDLKRDFRLKPNRKELPLLGAAWLHALKMELPHPITQQPLVLEAPLPKHLTVALKYLRRYASGAAPASTAAEPPPVGDSDQA
jgi:RluA family pseudouridine synthase